MRSGDVAEIRQIQALIVTAKDHFDCDHKEAEAGLNEALERLNRMAVEW